MSLRERIALLRWAAWALLGIALALEHGETPKQGLGEVIERLGRVATAKGAHEHSSDNDSGGTT
jgi:hypothetical protein